jgi:hypothetical protein
MVFGCLIVISSLIAIIWLLTSQNFAPAKTTVTSEFMLFGSIIFIALCSLLFELITAKDRRRKRTVRKK